jgi:hypothetical protein
MFFSPTGIAYLILSLPVGLLAYRFFQYWRQKKDTISWLLFCFVFLLFLFIFYKDIVCLFFANNHLALVSSLVFTVFIEGLAAAIVVYLVFQLLKFSKIISWLAFFLVFIFGLVVVWLDIKIPYLPFLEASGAINWGSSILTMSHRYLRLILLATSFVPLVIILIRQYIKTNEQKVKARAIGLGLALAAGVVIGFVDFFVDSLKLTAHDRDIIISLFGLFLFAAIYLTQKPPESSENI